VSRKGCKHTPEARAKMAASHRGKRATPETRAKLSAAARGKRHTPETKAKIAAWHRGRKITPGARAKISAALRGRPLTQQTKDKLSAARRGRKLSPEHCAKIGAANRGKKYGPHSAEIIAKMSVAKLGEKNPQWRGGISREPYGWEWNDELKEEVRRRDGYKCQLCGVPQAECRELLSVHHISYVKRNSDPVNLIALCRRCHVRTNQNRKHWASLFQARMIAAAARD